MHDPAASFLSVLSHGSAHYALELALAAREAGERAIVANPRLPPAEQFALPLQAADEALEGIGAALAEGDPPASPPKPTREPRGGE